MTPLKENDIEISFTGTTDVYNYPDPSTKAEELKLSKLSVPQLITWLQKNPRRGYGFIDEIRGAYEYELFSRFPFDEIQREIDWLKKTCLQLQRQIDELREKLKNHGHVGGEVMEKMK